MDEIIQKIKENQLFNGLDEFEIEKIFMCCKANIQRYRDNQAVFEKDDIINNVGIVCQSVL